MQEKFHAVANEQIILIEGETSTMCFGVIYSSPGLIRLWCKSEEEFLHLLVHLRL